MATRKTSAKTTKKAAKKTDEPVVIPPWPGISDDSLQALAAKIDKAKDSYRVSDMISKVNGDDWRSRHPIAWHLVACGAIHPESNPSVLEFIFEQVNDVAPELVLDVLAKLPAPSTKKFYGNSSLLMDGYSLTIDKVLFETYRKAPDVVQAREKDLKSSIRLGLSFIKRRLGETISPADSTSILKQLAKYQATSYGISTNHEMPVVENGELVKPRLADLAAVKKLALLFGTEKEWDDALLAEALEGKWHSPRTISDVFFKASTMQIAQLLNRNSISTGDALTVLIDVIHASNEKPEALIEAALAVTEEPRIRELLLMGAIYRAGKMGVPVPEKLDEVCTFELLNTTYEGVRPVCIEWCKYLPRDRAIAAARKQLAEEYQYSRAVGMLAVHFDEEILRAALEKDLGKNYISPETAGGLGANGLPVLEWAYNQATGDGVRSKHRAILHAMIKAAESGPLDARWDKYIDFEKEGGQAISYYGSSDSKPREMALQGIPEPRRSALLLKLLEDAKHPDRILQMAHLAADKAVIEEAIRKIVLGRTIESNFRESMERLGESVITDALCKHIGLSQGDGRFLESLKRALSNDAYARVEAALEKAGVHKETPRDALVRMAAEAGGTKERIYVLQVERDGYEPKEGTIARSGGMPPGIAEADFPKDESGEPLTHLFTLDLDEMPELQKKYSGARALAAFCPDPNSGDRTDEFQLVPITRDAVEALPNNDDEEDDARPICILPLDVPTSIFGRDVDDGPLKQIRKMIFNASGHVFGEPFWIQSDEGGFDFVMQINESLCDINLGDCGSLYVFDSGTVFQCY